MLAWYRALVALRRAEPDLQDDDLRSVQAQAVGEDRLVVRRGRLVVLVNLAEAAAEFDVPEEADVVLAWDRVEPSGGRVSVPSDGVVLLRIIPFESRVRFRTTKSCVRYCQRNVTMLGSPHRPPPRDRSTSPHPGTDS